ncbi:MAG: D-alanyl-D-alanine carboxypeptidase [Myxococcales bacterium]|nr:D-alanyl-D-alanine carboxypeptidase [Myxococcales bacterium]MBL0193976.1 D-alanyl-D-alanine carboxypeptidase [Myxococcales bacterium]
MRFATCLLVSLLAGSVACSAELSGDPGDSSDPSGESLEGLTAEDAEVRAERILREANARRTDFEPEENATRAAASEGSATAGGPLPLAPAQMGQVGLRTLTDDARAALGLGTWGFRFVVVPVGASAPRRVLSESGTSTKLMGASTFKMFTAWTAFKTGSTGHNTLTLMLRASKNPLANLAMCQNGEKLRGYDAPCVARTNATTSMRFKDAIPATRAHLVAENVAFSSLFTQRDGSGLDPANVLTVDDLTSLLDDINTDAKRSEFLNMLAQPGVASTLETRFPGLEGKLFAKTGTYFEDGGGVKSLAGMVDLGGGSTLLFVVVGNGVGDPKKALDRIETVVRLNIAAASPQ